MRIRFWSVSALIGLAASVCLGAAAIRQPVGVYMHVDQGDAVGSYPGKAPSSAALHAYLQNLYAGFLANGAISGITFGAHWDKMQLASGTAASSFDWSYLDDVFTAASAANKTVQLILTPGVDTPAWLMAQIPSCDPLFTKGSAPADCGSVTFTGFPEQQQAKTKCDMPLPWNTVYQQAWAGFRMTSVNARYRIRTRRWWRWRLPDFDLRVRRNDLPPTTLNTTAAQPSGLAPDDMWAALIQHSFPTNAAYQNSDQVFIDAWKQAIDSAEEYLYGHHAFPRPGFGQRSSHFRHDVSNAARGQHSLRVGVLDRAEGQFTFMRGQDGDPILLFDGKRIEREEAPLKLKWGMTALSPLGNGSIGIPGVKTLTSLTPRRRRSRFRGGAEFDYPGFVEQHDPGRGMPFEER